MEFNEKFARKVTDLVSKMDDDSAQMYVELVTYDLLQADLKANARQVAQHTDEVLKSIRDDVAKAASRLVSKSADTDMKSVAALVGLVSKAGEENFESEHPRGPGGQFRNKNSSLIITFNRSKAAQKQKKLTRKERKAQKKEPVYQGQFDLLGALRAAGVETNEFSRRWNLPDYDPSNNSGTYGRINAMGNMLGAVPNKKFEAAGQLGEIVGRYGPQAEQVVGPHLRRTAYRYRGTERTPDRALVDSAKNQGASVRRSAGLSGNTPLSPELSTVAAQRGAIDYLRTRLPSGRLSSLQQASGKIPPSEGVMINADGKIITQAVGYADDHYLPFNLKNLKGLKGGSYVRSRSTGGLTTEDIYTGLVSGARSVTVVSRSGVFTVNFDDTFRGGRRYNDKAAQMVGRYAQTLDAVKSKQVVRRDLTPMERASIRSEVTRQYEGNSYMDQSMIEDEIRQKEIEYRTHPAPTKAELDHINERAVELAQEGGYIRSGSIAQLHSSPVASGKGNRAIATREQNLEHLPADPKDRILYFQSQLMDDLMQEKTNRNYQLDGVGYAAALDALREQFPYYIESVNYPKNEKGEFEAKGFSRGIDQGYVKPKHIRPAGASAGYFDASINGETKYGADQENYQNWRHNPRRTGGRAKGEAQGADQAPKSMADQRKALAERIAEGQGRQEANKTLIDLARTYLPDVSPKDKDVFPILNAARADPSELQRAVDDVLRRPKLIEEVTMANQRLAGASGQDDPQGTALLNKFRAMDAVRDRKAYDEKTAPAESSILISRFDGPAYDLTASPQAVHAELSSVKRRLPFPVPEDVNDVDLQRLSTFYGQAAEWFNRFGKGDTSADLDQFGDIIARVGSLLPAEVSAGMANSTVGLTPERAATLATNARHVKTDIEKVRALNVQAKKKPLLQLTDGEEQSQQKANLPDLDDREKLMADITDRVMSYRGIPFTEARRKKLSTLASALFSRDEDSVTRAYQDLDTDDQDDFYDKLTALGYRL